MDDKIGQLLQIGGTQKLIPNIRLQTWATNVFHFTESLIFIETSPDWYPTRALTSDIPGCKMLSSSMAFTQTSAAGQAPKSEIQLASAVDVSASASNK